MKNKTITGWLGAAILAVLNLPFCTAQAASTIDAASKYSWGANLGWMDWRGDTNNGAVIGEYVCSGYLYSANVGWINLGSGAPTNQIQYKNTSASDFGVNQDGLGNLRGLAYGANIGWINFEATGAPKFDLLSGKFSGYAWSANCGWISLSNAVAYVKTDAIQPGTLAANGLPVAWLLTYFGATKVNANGDPDGDGMSNLQEYEAGTNPTNASSNLRITSYVIQADGTGSHLTWNSVATRFYYVQKNSDLTTANWLDSGLGIITPNPISTSAFFANPTGAAGFYRVKAVMPLTP